MGIKVSGVWYRQSGEIDDRDIVYKALENLDKYHGQVNGVFTGDEHFSGKNPSQGTELCAVVEYMFSLENLISIFGDPLLADKLEKIAFNALPATFKPDMWAHQYDQQVNQVLCNVARRDWTNGPDANIFGLEPHFGCCTANMHQGWPKLTNNLWMKTGNNGLATIVYAPCSIETEINSKKVTIIEKTDYPFSGNIRMTIEADQPVTFPLYLRIPDWVDKARIIYSDRDQEVKSGSFYEINREWHNGDTVKIIFPMKIRTERRYSGSVAVLRGPLVYSLKLGEEWKLIDGTPPHGDWEVYPTEPWNYGLIINQDIIDNIEIVTSSPGDIPFNPDEAPVRLKLKGKQIPEWKLSGNRAGEIPQSPVRSRESVDEINLIPYGCTNLRVTEFPLLEESF